MDAHVSDAHGKRQIGNFSTSEEPLSNYPRLDSGGIVLGQSTRKKLRDGTATLKGSGMRARSPHCRFPLLLCGQAPDLNARAARYRGYPFWHGSTVSTSGIWYSGSEDLPHARCSITRTPMRTLVLPLPHTACTAHTAAGYDALLPMPFPNLLPDTITKMGRDTAPCLLRHKYPLWLAAFSLKRWVLPVDEKTTAVERCLLFARPMLLLAYHSF